MAAHPVIFDSQKNITRSWNTLLLGRYYLLIVLMALGLGPTAPAITHPAGVWLGLRPG